MLLFPSITEHEEMRLRESKANQKRSVCATVQPMFLINVSPQVFVKQMRKMQTGHWIGQTSSEVQSNVTKSDVAAGVSQTLLSRSSCGSKTHQMHYWSRNITANFTWHEYVNLRNITPHILLSNLTSYSWFSTISPLLSQLFFLESIDIKWRANANFIW